MTSCSQLCEWKVSGTEQSLENHMIIRMGQCGISPESKEKSPLCQHPHAARMMEHSKRSEDATVMERDEEK